MKIYGIGGLGVDERVFSELKLDFDIIPLPWIEAEQNESLANYAKRFVFQIDINEPFSIIGVSFGGMLTIELNKVINPEKIILISSASTKSDIPVLFRVFGKSGLLNLIPNFLMRPPSFIANWLFGVSEHDYRKTLRQIISETDIKFLRWAIKQITRWDNNEIPSNLIRIHGSSDRLLRYSTSEIIHVIPNAGHLMIMNRSEELSTILNNELRNKR